MTSEREQEDRGIRTLYERGALVASFYWFSRSVCRVWCLLWHRLWHHGRRNIPQSGRVLLVANHCSFLDPVLVGTGTGRFCHYLARSSLGTVPVLGWLLDLYGVTFVDRDAPAREDLQKAIELLRREQALLIFPEGTRSRDGRLHEFKRGTVTLARRTRATVLPVGVRGAMRAFPASNKFPWPTACSVHFGEPMTYEEVAAPGGLRELERRVAALSGQEIAVAEQAPDPIREIPGSRPIAVEPNVTSPSASKDASAVNTGTAERAER